MINILMQTLRTLLEDKEFYHYHSKYIIKLLGNKSHEQRVRMESEYKMPRQSLKKDLCTKLKKYDTKLFKHAIFALFETKDKIDARFAFRKMSHKNNDKEVLVNTELLVLVLCTCQTNKQMEKFKDNIKYNSKLDQSKKKALKQHSLLKSMLEEPRQYDEEVDMKQAQDTVKKFAEGAPLWINVDKPSEFIDLLTSKSFSQLRKIFDEYKKQMEKDITESLEHEACIPDREKKLIINIVNCIRDPIKYIVDNLNVPSVMVHTILSRCEDDLLQIKYRFASTANDQMKNSLAMCIRKNFYFDENVCQLLLVLSGETEQDQMR